MFGLSPYLNGCADDIAWLNYNHFLFVGRHISVSFDVLFSATFHRMLLLRYFMTYVWVLSLNSNK